MTKSLQLSPRKFLLRAAPWLAAMAVFQIVGGPDDLNAQNSIQSSTAIAPNVRMNRAIEQLASGKPSISGVDHIWIDMEHGPFNIEKLETVVRVLSAVQNEKKQMILAPFVRIPEEGDSPAVRTMVKQVLERDVLGVIFPHVETKEQVMRIVQSMRYRPQKGAKYPEPAGIRGRSGLQSWGLSRPEYLRRADVWPLNPDGELFVMIQIEETAAVRNINDILDVPGVGAVFFSPNDLGMSLGVGGGGDSPTSGFNAPEVQQASRQVLAACIAKKVVCATTAGTDAEMSQRVAAGWRMFLGGGRSSLIRLETAGIGTGR